MRRPNRFLVIARLCDRSGDETGPIVRVASRDPGRLRELLTPGAKILLAPSENPRRRTAYTLALVRSRHGWVSLIPALANRLLERALARGGIPGLEKARVLRREVRCGESRFDFLLAQGRLRLLTEVKSATLVVRGRALFPDAPTERGTRHVRELTRLRRRGGGALLVFVVQRHDARSLQPNVETDPHFGAALAQARRAGVRLLAYTCRVGPQGCSLHRPIPVVVSI